MAGSRITKAENEDRVNKCLELRFLGNNNFLQKDWIKYCHENYNDKSEITYHKYWSDAKNRYEEQWRAKLDEVVDKMMKKLDIDNNA